MKTIYKLFPFLRAYKNHPIVQKYKRPAFGCIGCFIVFIFILGILIIYAIIQIIGTIDLGGKNGLVNNSIEEITTTIPTVADTGIIEQIRVFLLSVLDRLYNLVRSILV